MKNINRKIRCLPAWAFLCLGIAVTGCAGNPIITKPYDPNRMIHYSELKGMGENRNLNGYVLYVNKGERIPLQLSMETDFVKFDQDHIDLVARQKLYFMVKMPENPSADEIEKLNKLDAQGISEMSTEQRAAFLKKYMLYISKDALHWAPLYGGGKAIKEALGFQKGLLSFGILASTEGGLRASLDIRTVP